MNETEFHTLFKNSPIKRIGWVRFLRNVIICAGNSGDQDFKDKQDKIFIGSANKLKLKNKGSDVYVYIGKDLIAKVKGAKDD